MPQQKNLPQQKILLRPPQQKKAAVEEETAIPFLLLPFSTAAAAGGRTNCRISQNFAAIGALLYDARLKLKFYIFTNLFNMDGLDKAAYFTKMASSDNLIDYPMRFEYQDLFTMTQLVIIYFIVKNKTYIIEIVISNALCYPLFISVS